MFQLAACPACGVLQLHRDLDEVEARECRRCERTVPADEWTVQEEHEAFEAARDRLRRLRDRSEGPSGFSSGPPIPQARLPLEDVDPRTRQALRSTLADLATRDEPIPEDTLVDALGEAGAAHLRNHLLREGLLEPVPTDGDQPAYRVPDEIRSRLEAD